MTRALDLVASWAVPHAATAVCAGARRLDQTGEVDQVFRLASISKPMTAWAILVAVEEGIVELDSPHDAADPTRTLRHLLAHAAGYGFDSTNPIVGSERRRIYSNTGIEVAASLVEQAADMPFAEYLSAAVFDPLGMSSSELVGSPAHQVMSTANDVARFTAEVISPTLLSSATAAEAIRVQYPDLGGIVPGVGRFDESPWGLGFEIRGQKQPHWTGSRNSPSTFGHFGGSGTMMWTDPAALVEGIPLTLIALTDRRFDDWAADALRAWADLSDAVIAEFACGSTDEAVTSS